ncbi:MAG: flagellar hook-length control protein FliK [Pseudomonadota bacterium]
MIDDHVGGVGDQRLARTDREALATGFAAGGAPSTANGAVTSTQSFGQPHTHAAAPHRQIEAMQLTPLPDGRVEVQLEPPELGRLEITFDFGEEGLRAAVSSDRPGTLELVRRHAEMLLQHLRAAGFENATLDLSAQDRSAPQQDGSARRGHGAEDLAEPSGLRGDAVAADDRPDGNLRHLGSLDLRL